MRATQPELRVDMLSADRASFNGEELTSRSGPALAWARRLVDRGHPPETVMVVFRDGKPETRISIGVAARFAADVPADDGDRGGAQAAGVASSVLEVPQRPLPHWTPPAR